MPTPRATLRAGSRAAATREPCQVRKEAALSDLRRVPRNGLVRVARCGGRGDGPVDGGCTAIAFVRPEESGEPNRATRDRAALDGPAPGVVPALAGADVLADRRPGAR